MTTIQIAVGFVIAVLAAIGGAAAISIFLQKDRKVILKSDDGNVLTVTHIKVIQDGKIIYSGAYATAPAYIQQMYLGKIKEMEGMLEEMNESAD